MRWLSILLLCLAGCGDGTDSASPPAPSVAPPSAAPPTPSVAPPPAPSVAPPPTPSVAPPTASPPPPPQAAAISWDFEARTFPNPPDNPSNLVHPVVLNETNGNHYGRLTVSHSDCRTPGDQVWDPCPKIRQQVVIGTIHGVPGETRTFSLALRIPSGGQPATGHDSMLWQIIEPHATGTNQFERSFWIGIHDFGAGERVYLANRVPPCPGNCVFVAGDVPANIIDLGPLTFDQWDTYQIVMTLAVTPTNGTVIVRKNGTVVATVTNQPTMYLVDTQDFKMDVLDWFGTPGIADFDNVWAMSGAQS